LPPQNWRVKVVPLGMGTVRELDDESMTVPVAAPLLPPLVVAAHDAHDPPVGVDQVVVVL
jgi:hypothetical protein